MDKKMTPLSAKQREFVLLSMKLVSTGDLSRDEWRLLRDVTESNLPLEDFIAEMKSSLPALLYHTLYEHPLEISEEELGMWCLVNNLPID